MKQHNNLIADKTENSSEVIESIIGNHNQCELQSLEIHFVEAVWSLVGLRPKTPQRQSILTWAFISNEGILALTPSKQYNSLRGVQKKLRVFG